MVTCPRADSSVVPSCNRSDSTAPSGSSANRIRMLVDSGEPAPSTRMELLHAGRSLGTIDVPTPKTENDSLRQVGQLPIDKLPPGVYELRATITVGDRRVGRTAMFTIVP